MREIDRLRKDLRDFGNDGHVSKMLRMIFKYDLDDEQGFNGWEKWLQFELALFMDKQRGVHWFIESAYRKDNRKLNGDRVQTDIEYRRQKKGLYYALELKVNNSPDKSIRGVIDDLWKVRSIRPSEWEFRGVFGVAFFHPNHMDSQYVAFAEDKGFIDDFGPYKVAVIGWESGTPDNDKRSLCAEYGAWLNNLDSH